MSNRIPDPFSSIRTRQYQKDYPQRTRYNEKTEVKELLSL